MIKIYCLFALTSLTHYFGQNLVLAQDRWGTRYGKISL